MRLQAVVTVVLFSSTFAAISCNKAPANPGAERMDQVVGFYFDTQQFMGSALVARGDRVLFKKGYGSANLEWKVPNTTKTKFRLGSVTKQFTAASILLLEERGKLKTDDLLKAHMPDAPSAWGKITIFHLLTHTSGIPDFTGFQEFRTWKFSRRAIEDSIGLFRNKPLDFSPGDRFNYSNSGYILLSHLIERISGETYEAFVTNNILTPLGMKDSGYDSNEKVISSRAAGYAPGPEGLVNAQFVSMSIPQGGGGLYSTTEDLLRWTSGLFSGKVLSMESLAKMTTPFKENYALGLEVLHKKGRKVIRHGGGIEGFSTELVYYPDERLTIAVLGNQESDTPEEISSKLAAVAHGEKLVLPTERHEIKLPAEQLTKFVGSYELQPGLNIVITLAERQLTSQIGDDVSPLAAESDMRFFPRRFDGTIEFERDAEGKVTAATVILEDEKHRAPRVAEPNEVDLPADVLARYPGRYQIEPGLEFVATLESGKLMTQVTGQSKIRAYASAEDKFFLKAVKADLEFVKDPGGKVNAVILHWDGNDARAQRVR